MTNLSFGTLGAGTSLPFFTGEGGFTGVDPVDVTTYPYSVDPSDYDMGTPVVSRPRSEVVPPATGPVGGGGPDFLTTLTGFGSALLGGIGGTPEATYGPPRRGGKRRKKTTSKSSGFDVKTAAMIGGAGLAVYMLAIR